MKKDELTQERLKELIDYDPETGAFSRRASLSNRTKIGVISNKATRKGYFVCCVERNRYYLHRLAFLYMTGAFPEDQIDHINHVKTDNRWENLRSVDNTTNHKNAPLKKTNKSGLHGVLYDEKNKRWVAKIPDETGMTTYPYIGKDFFEACCARKSAEIKYGYHENHGV